MALTTCKECGTQISKKAADCPKCGAPAKKKTSLFTWLVTIVLAIWAIGYFGSTDYNSAGDAGTVRAPSPKQVAMKHVELDFTWSKAGFDSIMEADFTITNKSNSPIKDIEITCTHFAKSGTRIDSNTRTIYEVIPVDGKKVIPKFNMGFIHTQANSTSCRVTDLTL